MFATNLPFNDYIKLPDCPSCKKGKLIYMINQHAQKCTMCNYVIGATDSLMVKNAPEGTRHQDPNTRQSAINKWMNK